MKDKEDIPIHDMELLTRCMDNALAPPPTLQEFKDALRGKTRTRAGGITLCTYQMMRTWPPDYVKLHTPV